MWLLTPEPGHVLLEEVVLETPGQVILPDSAVHQLAPVYRALSGPHDGCLVVLSEPPHPHDPQWPVFELGQTKQIIVPEEAIVGRLTLIEGDADE